MPEIHMRPGAADFSAGMREKILDMKMYAATIKKDILEPRSRIAYYKRQKLLLVLIVTLVSVLPLIGISYLSLNYYKDSWIEKTSAELGSLADSRRETIELFLLNQNVRLGSLISLYSPEFLAQQDNLQHVYESSNRTGVMTDLGVIDQTGNHVAYVGPFTEQLAGVNYAHEDWFTEVMRKGNYTSDIFSGFRGVPHFVVAVANPERTQILRATINSDLFNALLASAELSPGGDAFIVNRAGEPQTPSRANNLETPFQLSELPATGTTVIQTDDYIYSATSLNDGNWILVLKEDIDSALTEFFSARNKVIVMVILAIVAIVGTATVLISSMVNRIQDADHQRTSLNNRVLESERMALIGRLAASVSHEINNPLQIIEGQAGWIDELLSDEKEGSVENLGEYRQAVAKIRTHVNRAKLITHRLLGFSHAGEMVMARTDINQVVSETVSFLEGEANKNGITIIREFQPDLPGIVTDSSQLQQVLLNLVNNAIDAIERVGQITVSTAAVAGGGIVISISDTGPGLSEEVRQRIFAPFFTTKNGKGTGLGLSISFNIIQRLGGDIKADNNEQGGSIFQVFLPDSTGGKQKN
ncbi:MAG: two-component sensor histidine kinase [Actinobacteria bacterium]|nr:two-component sensor histidine kinase [Actinomycetota bacterium]